VGGVGQEKEEVERQGEAAGLAVKTLQTLNKSVGDSDNRKKSAPPRQSISAKATIKPSDKRKRERGRSAYINNIKRSDIYG